MAVTISGATTTCVDRFLPSHRVRVSRCGLASLTAIPRIDSVDFQTILHPLSLSNDTEAVCARLLFWLPMSTPPCDFVSFPSRLRDGHLTSRGRGVPCSLSFALSTVLSQCAT
ncbi:hypothetical protein LIA77_04679 [Sarocladium implicatum]|nr:hypothetical protein LIA77_04679 [Sarocladium implicatum]